MRYLMEFIYVSCILNASYNIYAVEQNVDRTKNQDLYYETQRQHDSYNNQPYYWHQTQRGAYNKPHNETHQQYGSYNNQPYYGAQYGGDNYWNIKKTFAADDPKKSKKDKKRKKNKKWRKKRIYKSNANK